MNFNLNQELPGISPYLFGSHPEVALEVIIDSEAVDDRELFAFIRTSLPSDEVLTKLDRLDHEWWLDAMDRAKGKLCIHVEFSLRLSQ